MARRNEGDPMTFYQRTQAVDVRFDIGELSPEECLRISAIVTGYFGDRDRWPEGELPGPFRHRDRPFRRS